MTAIIIIFSILLGSSLTVLIQHLRNDAKRKRLSSATAYTARLTPSHGAVITVTVDGKVVTTYIGDCTVWRNSKTGMAVGNYNLIEKLCAAQKRAEWREGSDL